ncbi:hypothetical protein JVU11DRAFT_7895 [Chiua virens]|nr:hypothetical protein JVU11DRAFT_7895 [Chiua virens]
MNTASATQSTAPAVYKSITVSEIELQTETPTGPKLPLSKRKYVVQFSVGASSKWTQVAKETKNRTSWHETLYFDGDDRSDFVITVYQKHRIRNDQLVGSLRDTIVGVLGQLKDGVIKRTLGAIASSGSDLSGPTIKFALAVKLSERSNANELQARDALATAIKMVTPLSSMPGAVDLVTSMVQSGPAVMTQLQSFETTWDVLLKRLKLFDTIVTKIAEIHPYVSLAWSVISTVNKALIDQKDRDDKIIRLATTMSDVFEFVEDADLLKTIEPHIKNLTPLIQQVIECGYFIAEYSKRESFLIRTVKYTFSDINTKIVDYDDKLRDLKTKFLEKVTLQTGITGVRTEITVVRMMSVVEHIQEAIDLNDMLYASGARYSQHKGCLPGTREALLREVCDILNNPADDAPRVCLLTGVAGSGKSAVAHTIARLYDGQKRLGSSYCFASGDVARRNPANLFSTIARDLADVDAQYKDALWSIVKGNQALRRSETPAEQIERFIVEPIENFDVIGPIVVVIDALDESGEPVDRAWLLAAMSEQISKSKLPTNLRFFITSRPENDIINAFSCPHVVHKQMGDVPDKTVDEDIEKFIYNSLHQYDELESSWRNREWCHLLVRRSQGLFQWAATACNFIQGFGSVGLTPRQRFSKILQNDINAIIRPLDTLYHTILDHLFTRDDTRQSFRDVMAIVLALKEPLPLASLSALFDPDEEVNVQAILKPMASLLDGILNEDKPIQPLHASFRDFLLDQNRSSTLHVYILPHHTLLLGRALLACMKKMLKFNICDLQDTPCRNSDIADLPIHINSAIPRHLSYSCLYYMDHLQHTEPTPDIVDDVTLFFKNFFPYWLEVISLISHSSVSPILSASKTCTILQRWTQGQEIANLAADAFQFIQLFAPVLKESTPHLYLSAMPQTPTNSSLCDLWSNKLLKHAFVTSGLSASWPAHVHILQNHGMVSSVAYSPDGKYIAAGSGNHMGIRIWNATTGQTVAGSFKGIQVISTLLSIPQMASTLLLAQGTRPSGFGMSPLVRLWQVHLRGT